MYKMNMIKNGTVPLHAVMLGGKVCKTVIKLSDLHKKGAAFH